MYFRYKLPLRQLVQIHRHQQNPSPASILRPITTSINISHLWAARIPVCLVWCSKAIIVSFRPILLAFRWIHKLHLCDKTSLDLAHRNKTFRRSHRLYVGRRTTTIFIVFLIPLKALRIQAPMVGLQQGKHRPVLPQFELQVDENNKEMYRGNSYKKRE